MDLKLCSQHSNCEAPIKIITEILAKSDQLRYDRIADNFKLLGFEKIKDLANSSITIAGKIDSLGEDPVAELYQALQIYDQYFVEELKSAKLEYDQNNHIKTQEICNKLLSHKPTDVKVLVLLSASYFCCGEYSTSFNYLLKAQEIEPNSVEVLLNLGVHYYTNNKLKESFVYFTEALKKDLGNVNDLIEYAKLITLTGSKHEAEIIYKIILHASPDLYIERNAYAKVLISLNKLEEAEKQYNIAIDTAPQYYDSWNNLGNLYDKKDMTKEAIRCYKKASELDCTSPIIWTNLGIEYLKLKEYQNAIDNFQKALELFPEDPTNILKYLGNAYWHQKNWSLCIDTYKKVWKLESNDEVTNFRLGYVYFHHLNSYQEAEIYFENLLKINPLNENFHNYVIEIYTKQSKTKRACEAAISLGDMYNRKKDYGNAKNAYVLALHLDPENAYGHKKVGNVLYSQGCLEPALERYQYALSLKLDFPGAYYDCGEVYEKMNLLEKALENYKIAYVLEPSSLNYLNKFVFLQKKLGYFDNVAELYLKILKDNGYNDFDLNLELANIFYKKLGKLDDALFHYKKALEIDNNNLDVYVNMGHLYLELKKKEDALNCFNEAIKLNPKCTIAHTNAGSIYKDSEKYTEAINAYKIVLDINPDFPDAYCNLVQCLQQICDWSDYDNRILKLKEIVIQQLNNNQVPSLLPHHSLLYPFTPEVLKQIASKHAEQCIKKANIIARKVPQNYLPSTFLSNGRIRVGYVSSDFGDHPITQLMQSIPLFHDKNKVEVFCYSLSPEDDSPSRYKISTESDHFKDISELNIFDAANLINDDGIQILVNMNGYTKGARNEIFALRPAPIQVLWLGYPNTSGATFIDYVITDKVCSPPELGHYFTEKLAYMNRSVFIGDHKQMFRDLCPRVGKNNIEHNCSNELVLSNTTTSMDCDVNVQPDNTKCFSRQKYNLPENGIVYCNFGQLYKIEPSTFRMWVDILNNVPNSILWLLNFPYDGAQNLKKSAALLNIDLSRIIFSNVVSKEEHMSRIQLADIFLDTPLCNGHTTCLDALWAGTPVVTLPGNTFASRVAASQLTTLGCIETIAKNEKDYVRKATMLGSDKAYLESIRSKIWLLKTESDLFNCKSYTEELENIYQDIWKNYLSDKR